MQSKTAMHTPPYSGHTSVSGMNSSNSSMPCSLKWNSSSGVAAFSLFFSHMQTQCLFWRCHCLFSWQDGKTAGTPHIGANLTFQAMTNTQASVISSMTISDKRFHSLGPCYLGPLLYFCSHSYCFIHLHIYTYSLLKLCTTVSTYKEVSIPTVIVSLPSCK